LEARIPSNLVGRIGGHHFQSRADVMHFGETSIPLNTFYLFHDVVTLLESLTTSHVEMQGHFSGIISVE